MFSISRYRNYKKKKKKIELHLAWFLLLHSAYVHPHLSWQRVIYKLTFYPAQWNLVKIKKEKKKKLCFRVSVFVFMCVFVCVFKCVCFCVCLFLCLCMKYPSLELSLKSTNTTNHKRSYFCRRWCASWLTWRLCRQIYYPHLHVKHFHRAAAYIVHGLNCYWSPQCKHYKLQVFVLLPEMTCAMTCMTREAYVICRSWWRLCSRTPAFAWRRRLCSAS